MLLALFHRYSSVLVLYHYIVLWVTYKFTILLDSSSYIYSLIMGPEKQADDTFQTPKPYTD